MTFVYDGLKKTQSQLYWESLIDKFEKEKDELMDQVYERDAFIAICKKNLGIRADEN